MLREHIVPLDLLQVWVVVLEPDECLHGYRHLHENLLIDSRIKLLSVSLHNVFHCDMHDR